MGLSLFIGNQNYSSWSLRPWLAMKEAGLSFDVKVIGLDQPGTASEIAKVSPSGRVPALVHDDLTVWDSLAICEYVADTLAPGAELWPREGKARARARSVSAEMHSGFVALRTHLSMDIRKRLTDFVPPADAVADIRRIEAICAECLGRSSGPYLFGAGLTIADAMYAPVVFRFLGYGVKLEREQSRAYVATMLENRWMREWAEAARVEKLRVPRYE